MQIGDVLTEKTEGTPPLFPKNHESQFYILPIYFTFLSLSFNQYIEFTINIVTR